MSVDTLKGKEKIHERKYGKDIQENRKGRWHNAKE